ncbi:uncharacterized protein LOC132731057 [Ruditapes philippinarum]|uniref:uncharacterized protein LOC132731057 n=1 Tax=Ruditapes philippinarum TaxID=129788 RepID=UPI00295B40A9|nr:uncharacterized protein LOC132731057 [Ruditapes philippinarum]
MFTVPVSSNTDENQTINAQFENEAQTVHEMTSHELGNPGDLGQGDSLPLGQIDSQCPQALSQPDVTSAQGSYVSLLADIATIQQTDEYSAQPIADVISDTDYATSTFTNQELTSLHNDNMVSYQPIENSNISYNLTNTVGNSQGIQQFVIIQPFLSDTSVNAQSTFIHLPNTADNQLNLDSNKELEDAVANITDTAVAGDTNVVTSESGSLADKSYLVCTNSRGEVREIQVIQGKQNWTENDTEVISDTRKCRPKGVKGKQRKSVITERKQSSSHLQKFSLDDLNSAGKSKKEVFEEYLEKGKPKTEVSELTKADVNEKVTEVENSGFGAECGIANTHLHDETITEDTIVTSDMVISRSSDIQKVLPLDEPQNTSDFLQVNRDTHSSVKDEIVVESLESEVIESLQKPLQRDQEADEEENVSCDKLINKDANVMKSFNKINKNKTVKTKTMTLRCRRIQDQAIKSSRKTSESFRKHENDTDCAKLKRENRALKRKKSVPQSKGSCKLPKLDNLYDNEEQVQDNTLEGDVESRMQEDFCRLFKSDEKCVLRLEPITLKLVNPNRFLMIEMDIENELYVSTIEKGETTNGFTKYFMKLTAPENVLQASSEETNSSEKGKNKVKRASKLKCLKHSKIKCKRTIAKKVKTTSLKDIKPVIEDSLKDNKDPIIKDENMGENVKVPDTDPDIVYSTENTNLEDTADVEDYNVEIEVEGYDDNIEKSETLKETEISSKNDDKGDIEGDKSTGTNTKKRKTRNVVEKKESNANPSSTVKKKGETTQLYTVMISEEGKKMYQCIMCGKEMTIKQNMDIHINQHTGERPWQCEVCGLGFRGPSNLKAHMNQHDEELRFSCDICFRKFRDRGTYRQHYKRHLGEKEHVCEHCGKSFVITSDLKKHIRTHTGEKPYKCSSCDQQFSDGSSLVRHEKMHSAKFRYECGACSRQYSRKDLCKKHIKKAHINVEEIEINEISVIDELKQVSRDIKVRNQDGLVIKTQKVTGKKMNREQNPNTKVKKMKKSWQNLTEEASKRYKEQTNESIPGPSRKGKFPKPFCPNI